MTRRERGGRKVTSSQCSLIPLGHSYPSSHSGQTAEGQRRSAKSRGHRNCFGFGSVRKAHNESLSCRCTRARGNQERIKSSLSTVSFLACPLGQPHRHPCKRQPQRELRRQNPQRQPECLRVLWPCWKTRRHPTAAFSTMTKHKRGALHVCHLFPPSSSCLYCPPLHCLQKDNVPFISATATSNKSRCSPFSWQHALPKIASSPFLTMTMMITAAPSILQIRASRPTTVAMAAAMMLSISQTT